MNDDATDEVECRDYYDTLQDTASQDNHFLDTSEMLKLSPWKPGVLNTPSRS